MTKRASKQRSRSQTPRRRKAPRSAASGSASRARGTLGAFRGGLKGIFGTSSARRKPRPSSRAGRVLDVLLWLAVLGALFVFFTRQ